MIVCQAFKLELLIKNKNDISDILNLQEMVKKWNVQVD